METKNLTFKLEKKKVKILEKQYRKALDGGLNPVDALLYLQQRQPKNAFLNPPNKMQVNFRNGGVFFGRDFSGDSSCYIGKSQQEDGHVLVIGSPGCYKTTGIILPSILTWQGTFVAVDIKGDISEFCHRYCRSIAAPVKIIDFSGHTDLHFDPFHQLRAGGENELISNARDLALAIIPTPTDVRELFWVQGAQNILTAVILYAFGHGMNFNEMVQMTLTYSAGQILKAVEGSNNDAAKRFMTQYSSKQLSHSDDKTLQGSFIELANHLHDFSHPQIQDVFTADGNCVDWEQDSLSGNYVIHIPEARINQWGGAVRLILRQLFSVLSNRPEKYSFAGRCRPPFLLLWDELPRFGKFEDLVHFFSTMRSKGVTICATIQSYAQLDHIYGSSVRRVLVDCCAYNVIGAVQDVETQQYCSALVGSTAAWELGVGENYYPNRKEFAFSRNLNRSRQPILYPEEFATLDAFVVSSPYGKFFLEKAPLFDCPPLPIEDGYKDGCKEIAEKLFERSKTV